MRRVYLLPLRHLLRPRYFSSVDGTVVAAPRLVIHDTSHAIAALEAVSRVVSARRRAGPHALQASGETDDTSMLYTVAARELLGIHGISNFFRWELLADAVLIFGAHARKLERLPKPHSDYATSISAVSAAAILRATHLVATQKTFGARDVFGLARFLGSANRVSEACPALLRVALPRCLDVFDARKNRFDATRDSARVVTLNTIANLAVAAVLNHRPPIGGGEGRLWGLNRHLCAAIADVIDRARSDEWASNAATRAAVRVVIGRSLVSAAWALSLGGALSEEGRPGEAAAVVTALKLVNDLYADVEPEVRCALLAHQATIGRLNAVLCGVAAASAAGRLPIPPPALAPALADRLRRWREWAKINSNPSHAALMMANVAKGPARRAGYECQTLEADVGLGLFVDLALTRGEGGVGKGKGIAIEVDGPSHFVDGAGGGGDREASSRTMYKRWLLKEGGWAVVSIAWDDWALAARGGFGESERYIEGKIQKALAVAAGEPAEASQLSVVKTEK